MKLIIETRLSTATIIITFPKAPSPNSPIISQKSVGSVSMRILLYILFFFASPLPKWKTFFRLFKNDILFAYYIFSALQLLWMYWKNVVNDVVKFHSRFANRKKISKFLICTNSFTGCFYQQDLFLFTFITIDMYDFSFQL